MNKYRAIAFGMLTFWLSSSVFSQSTGEQKGQLCGNVAFRQVGAHLGVSKFTQSRILGGQHAGGIVVSAACKVWPKDKAVTIATFAYDNGLENEKALAVALIESETSKVLSIYRGVIQEDAGMRLEEGSLTVDTARYNLSKDVRAFGIDVISGYNPNCGDGGAGAERSLFVQDGKTLKLVLEKISLSNWRFVKGGNPRCMSTNEAAKEVKTVIENSVLSIDIGKEVTNGFSDLLITALSTHDDGSVSKRRPFRYQLKFDGQRYPMEKMQKAYWTWSK